MFCEEEAQKILSVPISSMGVRDILIWSSSSNGQYSIASAYRLAKFRNKQKEREVGPSCKREEEEKMLWMKFGP